MTTKKTNTNNGRKQANSAPVESNSLIAPEADPPALPPGKIWTGLRAGEPLDASYIESALRAHFEHWEEGVGEAHERLYRFLGWVYEWAPLVKANLKLADDIAERIKHLHGKSRSPDKASGEELLLILALGFGKAANSNRCNWLKAIRAADQADVARDASSCGDWFREKGGMKAAGALYRAEAKTPQSKFDPVEYIAMLAESATSTEAELDAKFGLEDGTHIILVNSRSEPGGETALTLLAHLGDPDTLGLVAKAHMLRTKKLDGLLWDLNRYALKAAGHAHAGKISGQDLKTFAAATVVLMADPEWRQRFFTEQAEPIILKSDVSKNDRLQLVNSSSSFNIHDPGRFIPGARQGALIPYEPDAKEWGKLSDLERLESKARSYIRDHSKKPVDPEEEALLRTMIAKERQREQEEREREQELEEARSKQLEDV